MPRFFCASISVICLMLVVPEVDMMVLPFRSSTVLQVGRLLRDEAVGGDEMGDGEGDLLLPLEIVGGRAAFQIDRAVRHQRDARGGGHRVELDLELVELELLLHRIDDLVAQVHRVADDLLLVVVIGERHRRLAMPDGDRAGILDLLQRPCQFLRDGRLGGEAQRCNRGHYKLGVHRVPPASLYKRLCLPASFGGTGWM